MRLYRSELPRRVNYPVVRDWGEGRRYEPEFERPVGVDDIDAFEASLPVL
jgi:hypothetical protein